MSRTQLLGQAAERQAQKYLEAEGFQLVEKNFSAKTGEIDLIMENGELLAFIEVRLRTHDGFGSGADSVTKPKQKKIINTAKLFLQRNKNNRWQSFRFDVVSIGADVDWIPGAFTLN